MGSFLLALLLAAGIADYPPSDCILLQRGTTVPLRWNLPGQHFQLEVVSPGQPVILRSLEERRFDLTVAPGRVYRWTVTSNGKARMTRSFSVAGEFAYHRDGHNGTGEPGGHIQARLERDSAGMNLLVDCAQDRLHYLFVEPNLKFLLSARGGDGREGQPGMDVPNNPCRPGNPGGAGGWGGEVRIRTVSAPWRDYLEVDVSPGQGGPGGRGGRAVWSHVAGYDSARPQGPQGPPGPAGRMGTVITSIER
ncbi:MAG: hypothetical protein J0I12_32070 [Candidatus Eremiobacteraeota bacterium]|nr:hypothetical protein [Candidatus Eremiobacteraeota bacterium]